MDYKVKVEKLGKKLQDLLKKFGMHGTKTSTQEIVMRKWKGIEDILFAEAESGGIHYKQFEDEEVNALTDALQRTIKIISVGKRNDDDEEMLPPQSSSSSSSSSVQPVFAPSILGNKFRTFEPAITTTQPVKEEKEKKPDVEMKDKKEKPAKTKKSKDEKKEEPPDPQSDKITQIQIKGLLLKDEQLAKDALSYLAATQRSLRTVDKILQLCRSVETLISKKRITLETVKLVSDTNILTKEVKLKEAGYKYSKETKGMKDKIDNKLSAVLAEMMTLIGKKVIIKDYVEVAKEIVTLLEELKK